jgi:serine/threonine protein kinase
MKRLHIIKRIGQGSYSDVYQAQDVKTSRIVAVKQYRSNGDDGIDSSALREISALRLLYLHPNIVELVGVVLDTQQTWLILECMNQDLYSYIESCASPLPPDLIRSYLFQLISGLHYCHCNHLIHRDIKPNNLLINKAGTIKIADFGQCRSVPVGMYIPKNDNLSRRTEFDLLALSVQSES